MFHLLQDRHFLNLEDVRLAKVTPVEGAADFAVEVRTRSNPTENLYLRLDASAGDRPAHLWNLLEQMTAKAPFLAAVGGRIVLNTLDVARMAVLDVRDSPGRSALEIRFLSAPKDVAYVESKAAAGARPDDLFEIMRLVDRLAFPSAT